MLYKLFETIENKLKNNIKLKSLTNIVSGYNSDDWKKYIKINQKCYNRNIIKKNDTMELVIITWNVGQKTERHAHPEGGCVFKVLQGDINEQFYQTMNSNENVKHLNKYKKNDVAYIDNTIGYHLVHNNYKDICVSLHIYSPPFEHCCE